MKKFTTQFFFYYLILFALSSCHQATESEEMYASSIGVNKTVAKLAEPDVEFLAAAYSKGLLNIQMAEEAMVRSTSPEARQLAEAVKYFYLNANTNIEAISTQHNFKLPLDLTDEQKATWKTLVKEKGWHFDIMFREMCDEQAQKDLAFYSAADSRNKDVQKLSINAIAQIKKQSSLSAALCSIIENRTFDNVDPLLEEPDKTRGTINAIVKK